MVEVNSTFYAVPEARLVTRWCHATPDRFVFDVKLHRLLSRHAATPKSLPPALQRMAEADEKGQGGADPEARAGVARAADPVGRAAAGGETSWARSCCNFRPAFSPGKHDLAELDELLARLAPLNTVVELRNRHWLEGDQLARTLDFFRRHQTALVLVDAPNDKHFTIMPSDFNEVTNARLAYLRLHGRNAEGYLRGKTVAERFYYDYSDEEISEVAERAKKLAQKADTVHVIFNNNALDFAPHAALRLRAALGQLAKAPPRQAELFR